MGEGGNRDSSRAHCDPSEPPQEQLQTRAVWLERRLALGRGRLRPAGVEMSGGGIEWEEREMGIRVKISPEERQHRGNCLLDLGTWVGADFSGEL